MLIQPLSLWILKFPEVWPKESTRRLLIEFSRIKLIKWCWRNSYMSKEFPERLHKMFPKQFSNKIKKKKIFQRDRGKKSSINSKRSSPDICRINMISGSMFSLSRVLHNNYAISEFSLNQTTYIYRHDGLKLFCLKANSRWEWIFFLKILPKNTDIWFFESNNILDQQQSVDNMKKSWCIIFYQVDA